MYLHYTFYKQTQISIFVNSCFVPKIFLCISQSVHLVVLIFIKKECFFKSEQVNISIHSANFPTWTSNYLRSQNLYLDHFPLVILTTLFHTLRKY